MITALRAAVEPENRWSRAQDAFARHAPRGRTAVICQGDLAGYNDAVAERWGRGDDLLVVEQDIILHSRVLPQLAACAEDWCVFPYRHPDNGNGFLLAALGCTRFSARFQEAVAIEAIAAVYGYCNTCKGQLGCWAHLEGRISDAGLAAGFTRHVHWPSVGHRDIPPGEYPEEN